jgi:hypothetical protein
MLPINTQTITAAYPDIRDARVFNEWFMSHSVGLTPEFIGGAL